VVALSILQQLDPHKEFKVGIAVYDLHISHCQYIVDLVETHFRTHLPGDFSATLLGGLVQVCTVLIQTLEKPLSQDIFIRAAAGLHRGEVDFPGIPLVMRSIEVAARRANKGIPSAANCSFQSSRLLEGLDDLPTKPQISPERGGNSVNGPEDLEDARRCVDTLIRSWDTLTIEDRR
jgi:hypothetical protein